ncbi:DUF302 domain-containing protein [Dinoroseobacter sp. S375]|uniref:DUF302 domain-containing protein n=1 Tax=Dinoroseobacter sp. S375 TaxID=3415136 RepID=UPI003C7B03A1
MTIRALVILCLAWFGGPALADDIAPVTVPSAHSAAETIAKLEAEMATRNLTLLAKIDHQAAAAGVDLQMPAATVLYFGVPKAGTPMFLKAPTLAIDLPLRALVYETGEGEVFVAYNSGEWLAETVMARHGLEMPAKAQAGMSAMLSGLVEAATAE